MWRARWRRVKPAGRPLFGSLAKRRVSGSPTLYNGQYLEQFYEASLNTIEVVPVFVVYCPANQAVTLNDEHTDYRWCSLAEAKALVSFPGQKALYDHIWHHFVDNAPSPLMRVDIR